MPIIKSERDVSICYEFFGDPSNPCVIFIAGITGQLISWPDSIIQGLVNAGFYVVTFDNRDVGLSSYYDHLDTPPLSAAIAAIKQGKMFNPPYTLNDMAQDIVILMDQLTVTKAHIVGISMGGQIAQIFAIEHPDRILSLTCIATSSGDPELPPPNPEVMDFFFNSHNDSNDFDSLVSRHVAQYKLYNHPDDFDLDSTKALHEKAYQRAYHPEGNQRHLLAMISANPRGELLKSVVVPSLIIHGDCDPVVPLEHGKQLAECLTNRHLFIIERMGHGLPKRVCALAVKAMIKHFSNISLPGNRDLIHDFDDRGFEATRNSRGFMHTLNEISQEFIDFAQMAPGMVVDIGAAYGIATIPIINQRIQVVACDMDNKHLNEIENRIALTMKKYLIKKHGQFPQDITFDKGSVGAILLSHILPFLNPGDLDLAFEKLSEWLAPGGKVFIVCYSPYMACFKRFISLYEKRLADGIKWPCWVKNNVKDYLEAPQDVLENLPNTMNYLDLEPLTNALKSNDFSIEKSVYLDPKINNIPEGLILDGREWTGVIAIKKTNSTSGSE